MLMRDGFLKMPWKYSTSSAECRHWVYLLQSCVLLFVNVSTGSISHLVLHFFAKARMKVESIYGTHVHPLPQVQAYAPGQLAIPLPSATPHFILRAFGKPHMPPCSCHLQPSNKYQRPLAIARLVAPCAPNAVQQRQQGHIWTLHEPLQWKRTPILLRPIATVRSCFLPIPQPRYYTDSVGTAPCLHIRSHPRKATTATFRPRHLRIPLPESLSCPGVVQHTAVKPRWMHPQPYPQDSWRWLKAFRPRDLASPSPITTTSCHTKPTYDLDTDFDTVPAQSILKAPGHDDTLVLPLQYPAYRIRFHQDTRFGTVDPWLCRRAQTPNGHLAIVTSCQSWPAVTRAATSAVSSPDTPQFPLTLSLLHVARLRLCCTTKTNGVPFGHLTAQNAVNYSTLCAVYVQFLNERFFHMFLAFFNKKRRYRLKLDSLDDSVARKKAGGRRRRR